jgi:hypothetical protein
MPVSDVLRILRPKYVDTVENYTVKYFIVFKLRCRGIMVRFLAGERGFLLCKNVLSDRLWAPPIFERMAGPFRLGKAVGSRSDLR